MVYVLFFVTDFMPEPVIVPLDSASVSSVTAGIARTMAAIAASSITANIASGRRRSRFGFGPFADPRILRAPPPEAFLFLFFSLSYLGSSPGIPPPCLRRR